jgi:hypothetical protein
MKAQELVNHALMDVEVAVMIVYVHSVTMATIKVMIFLAFFVTIIVRTASVHWLASVILVNQDLLSYHLHSLVLGNVHPNINSNHKILATLVKYVFLVILYVNFVMDQVLRNVLLVP